MLRKDLDYSKISKEVLEDLGETNDLASTLLEALKRSRLAALEFYKEEEGEDDYYLEAKSTLLKVSSLGDLINYILDIEEEEDLVLLLAFITRPYYSE
jgi:hypothetical protein